MERPDERPREGRATGLLGDLVTSAQNLREDERALRQGARHCRAAALSDRVLSIGAAVRSESAYVRAAEAEGLSVVRRSTGGTGVLHLPGDLAWSVVLPRSDPEVGRDFTRAYARLGRGAVRFLADQGVDARWVPAPGAIETYCVLSARGHVLMVDGRVLGGAAQHATSTALLHHGTIARAVDPATLASVFGMTEPEMVRRLAGTDDLGLTASPQALAGSLARALRSEFDDPD